MNKKDIEKLFINENKNININQSQNLKNIPLAKKEIINRNQNNKRIFSWKIFPLALCSFVMIFVALFAILPTLKNETPQGQYTSYILEINPQLCITTDNSDFVVSIISLNNDADIVLSDDFFNNIEDTNVTLNDCLDRIIDFVYDENPDKFLLDNGIKLYATNDVENIAKDKLTGAKQHISQKLENLGKSNIPINEEFLPHQDFGNKMGFENFDGMDNMIDDIKNKDKFFDSNKNGPHSNRQK